MMQNHYAEMLAGKTIGKEKPRRLASLAYGDKMERASTKSAEYCDKPKA